MRCPLCDKPAHRNFRPFCSKRCADTDLSRWFRGDYAVAAIESDDEPGESDANIDDLERQEPQ